MEKNQIVLFLVVFFAIFDLGSMVNAMGTKDGLEQWAYTEVRPGEFLFWWYYKSPNRTQPLGKPWPLILWLQGGPGTSGVGMGNFLEIGPLDQHLNERESTWLDLADLLFVDCPIGTGYSYRNKSGEEISDEETVSDLTQFLIQLYNSSLIEGLEERILYIVGESYGGRYATALALSLLHSVQFNATLGGVILGDAWISPVDYTNYWSPILTYASRLDETGLLKCYKLAKLIKKQVEDDEDFKNATASFLHLQQVIYDTTNGGDLYNLMLDVGNDPFSTGDDANFKYFMNNHVREKLQIIPNNVRWVMSSDLVFNLSAADFMRPRIEEVDSLLEEGINVTIYNGQWDVLCSPMGTEAWMKKLRWKWLPDFWSTERTPIYYGEDNITTMGFQKSYKNLIYAVIFGAGHHVPVDRPLVTRNLIRQVTNSPAA